MDQHPIEQLTGEEQVRLLRALAEQTLGASFVERQWGNGRQFVHLLFTGGGAEALRATLLRQYPQGVVLPNAVTANALGLARYAARVFRK